MLTACTCANRSTSSRRTGVLRSDENAIHFPSGDQHGRKLPGAWVRFRAFLVCKSSTQMSADPVPREDTNASCFPSRQRTPGSSYAGSSLTPPRPDPPPPPPHMPPNPPPPPPPPLHLP